MLAHPGQLEPPGEWRTWYVRGGRGGGKTWTGANNLADWIRNNPPGEWAVVAPTYGDARDTCIESEYSGLLAAFGLPRNYGGWNRSMGELFLPDGSVVYADGADDGALRIQGKNLRGAWADEVGLWKNKWDLAWNESIAFAVRMDPARIIATGTPKSGHPLVRFLMDDAKVPKTLLRTMDNAANLSESALADFLERFGGSRRGRQELEGEDLRDVPDSLWKPDDIRYGQPPERYVNGILGPSYSRKVVSVDPSATSTGDECGIAGVGLGIDGRGYVIEDASVQGSPTTWATAAVNLYDRLGAGVMLVESNQGGEMAKLTIHSVDKAVNVQLQTAIRSKWDRAEPVQALYEADRVRHVRPFPELEDEMNRFTLAVIAAESPNRVDAVVHGLRHLMLKSAWGTNLGSGVA